MEDKQIIRRAGVAFNYGVFVVSLKARDRRPREAVRLMIPTSLRKNNLNLEQYHVGQKILDIGALAEVLAEMEESKNFQRSNKIKIKINS